MYQSRVLEEFMTPEPVPEVAKEKEIESVIRLLSRKKEGIWFTKPGEAINDIFLFCWLWFSFTSLTTILVVHVLPGEDGRHSGFWVWMILFGVGTFLVSPIIFLNHKDKEKEKGRYRDGFEMVLTRLFYLLSNKPFEFRAKNEIKDDQWVTKIVVESNVVQPGGHVIKDKTQHFTAYINPQADTKTIVSHLMEIVKKAEQFK